MGVLQMIWRDDGRLPLGCQEERILRARLRHAV
jgi:hypothetical protein